MDKEIRRSIILDNYENKENRCRIEDKDYIKHNSRNVSCIDNIDLYVKMNGDVIDDISFDGEACVISISTTSVLSKMLHGKTIDEAIDIIDNYNDMIEETDFDENKVGEAIVYEDVSKQPSRKKCATLTWNGIYKKLMELKNKK